MNKKKQFRTQLIFILFLILLFSSYTSFLTKSSQDIENHTKNTPDLLQQNNHIDFFSISHPATAEEINRLKQQCGVSDRSIQTDKKNNNRVTGYLTPSEAEWDEMIGNLRIVDSTLLRDTKSNSIDLSTDPFFPIVGNQGTQGSCAAWAASYSAMGYVFAKQNGWGNASTGNISQLLSPAFSYNKANEGYDSGSSFWGIGQVMNSVGTCRWINMVYDETDSVSWGNESAWRDAPYYRIENIYGFTHPYNDSTVNTIKNILTAGTPVVFALNSASYNYFGSDDVLDSTDVISGVNHGNCIVGYNDSKTDADSVEIGAFKVVNSWGGNWGPNNNGFYWLTYDAFKTGSSKITSVTWFDASYNASNNEQPELLATWEHSTQPYRDASVQLGIGSMTDPVNTKSPWWNGWSNTNHEYPSFMCLDLTEFTENLSQGHSNFFLTIGNSTEQNGTISSFHVEYYQDDYIPGQPDHITRNSMEIPQDTPGSVNVSFSPVLENPLPENGAIDVALNPCCTITVSNISDGSGNVSIYENSSGTWVLQQTNHSVSNDTSIRWNHYGNATAFNTTYYWKICATDGFFWTNETYQFTTRTPFIPNTTQVFTATTLNRTEIQLFWTPGDNASHTYIEYNSSDTWPRGNGFGKWNCSNTSLNHTGLSFDTIYYYQAWSYNETDNLWSDDYSRTQNRTQANTPPFFSDENPGNETTGIPINADFTAIIADSDGDEISWWITCSNEENTSGTRETDGSKILPLSTLQYNTTYTMWVNANDGYDWRNETYWFSTQAETAFVDETYNSATPGWNITHFNTIQTAINKLVCNGTIFINNGTYHEQIIINKSLTLQANQSSTPVIDGRGATGIEIVSNYTNINHISLKNCSTAFILSNQTETPLHHIRLSHNSIETSNTCIYSNATFDNQTIVISQNIFHQNNTGYGINFTSIANPIDAANNYWGSITGPYHETENPNGTGLPVSNNIQFTPWSAITGGTINATRIQTNQTTPGLEQILSATTIANTQLNINTTTHTNVTIACYTQQPSNLANNLTTIGTTIDIEIENQSAVLWPINISIYYTPQDIINADINKTSIDGLYYYNESEETWKRYQNTDVNTTPITLNGINYDGYCWAEINQGELSPKIIGNENNPPSQPSNPSPNGTNNVGINPTLQVSVDDIDGNTLTVFFINNQSKQEIGRKNTISSGDTATLTWSNRAYSTSYEWYVIINDSKSETISSVYQFTTKSAPSPSNGPSSNYQPLPPSNQKPVAEAVKSSTALFVNSSIEFNGSQSTDDGTIMNYTWDFGDETKGYGIQINHTYFISGNYTITLTVTDDEGASATDSFTITILPPPAQPPVAEANGPYTGVVNKELILNATGSVDPDGTITHYIWTTETNQTISGKNPILYYPNPGVYTLFLTVTDSDQLTDTDSTTVTIYQGKTVNQGHGYIIDIDNDGIIDSYLNTTKTTITSLQTAKNGCYYIDETGKGNYTSMYDPSTGSISPIETIQNTIKQDNPWYLYIITIAVIILIIILALFKTGFIYIE